MKRVTVKLLSVVLLLGLCVPALPAQQAQAWSLPQISALSLAKTLRTPSAPTLENVNGGVKISWKKVSGAAKYRVFYRVNGKGGWKRLVDTTKLTCTWKKVKAGTKYTFTVRCISANGKRYTSGYNRTGRTITYVPAPALKSLKQSGNNVVLTWGRSAGAAKYRVFRKTAGGKWVRMADTTKLTYTDAKAVAGVKYIYTVRCVTKNGKSYTSGYNKAGKAVTPLLSAPVLESVETSGNTAVINWNPVKGAAKYRVFCKTGSGGWKNLGDTASASYTARLDYDTVYCFTVRCLTKDGKAYASSYDKTGLFAVTGSEPAQEPSDEPEVPPTSTPVEPPKENPSEEPTEPEIPVSSAETDAEQRRQEAGAAVVELDQVYQAARKYVSTPSAGDTFSMALSEAESVRRSYYIYISKGTFSSIPTAQEITHIRQVTQELAGQIELVKDAENVRQADEERRRQAAGQAIEALDAIYKEAGNFQRGQLSDEVFFHFNDVFYTEQEVRKKYIDYILRGTFKTVPTDQEIEDIRQSTQHLTELLELAKLPSSQAVFDPSKLVYYKTESIKLHEMFNAFRIENGRKTTEWLEMPADCARVQASYNAVASALIAQEKRAAKWNSARHEATQIGTNDIDPCNEASYAEDAFEAFINSPPHKSNVLAVGDRGRWEGIAIVGYAHHGFQNIVCICDGASVCLELDGFNYAWDEHFYVTVNSGEFWFESIPGCTREAVKNCQVK